MGDVSFMFLECVFVDVSCVFLESVFCDGSVMILEYVLDDVSFAFLVMFLLCFWNMFLACDFPYVRLHFIRAVYAPLAFILMCTAYCITK